MYQDSSVSALWEVTDGSPATSCEESTVWRPWWLLWEAAAPGGRNRALPAAGSSQVTQVMSYRDGAWPQTPVPAPAWQRASSGACILRWTQTRMSGFFFFLSTESKKKKKCITEEKKCPKLQAPRGLSSQSSLLWRVVHSLLPLPTCKDSPGSSWWSWGVRPGGLWHLDGEPVPLSLCFRICSSALRFSPKSHLYLFNCTCPFAPSCPVL